MVWSSLDPVRIAIMACIGQGSVLPDFTSKKAQEMKQKYRLNGTSLKTPQNNR